MRKARLTTVRPAMMYGAQVWSVQEGEAPKVSAIRPLKTIQNKCLRSVTGGYRRTPTASHLWISTLKPQPFRGLPAPRAIQYTWISAVSGIQSGNTREDQTRQHSDRQHTNRDQILQRNSQCTLSEAWLKTKWKERWTNAANGKIATTWNAPWNTSPLKLYDNLPKVRSIVPRATALMLLRTEVIGLNVWLASVNLAQLSVSFESLGPLPHRSLWRATNDY
jgi:hypothetical protein